MFKFRYGGRKGKAQRLYYSSHHVAVRTHSHRPVSACVHSRSGRQALDLVEPVFQLPTVGVELFKVRASRKRTAVRDEVRSALATEREVQFAGRVLYDRRSAEPVLYTENLFVKFQNRLSTTACRRHLREAGLKVKRELYYSRNAFFVSTPESCGTDVFTVAESLLANEVVDCVHPELVREARRWTAFPQQWHLKKTRVGRRVVNQHANVEPAWEHSEGEGVVIAVIDDGVDIHHEEFQSHGKIVAPRNVTARTDNPCPSAGDNHGTACAGVACADGFHGASGVAPRARLMPIRLVSGVGSQDEADAFCWAAQNGADVISCSWGPSDGRFRDPDDPLHRAVHPLPDATRLALEYALEHGRGGRGCVVVWAAGNGNESVDNDGYASFEKVIAVAASNDEGKRSEYSDFGDAIWCTFPSSDFRETTCTPGIWSTDRSGAEGYNHGLETLGDARGNYTNSFGGTSSACPGVAGVAALILARNPDLRWHQVKEIIKQSCEQIDRTGGDYDARGHSKLYGYGRVDTAQAVMLAAPDHDSYEVAHSARQDIVFGAGETAELSLAVGDLEPIRSLIVEVTIRHPNVEDLVVSLVPPAASGRKAIKLHDRVGGTLGNLERAFDLVNTPALETLVGLQLEGTWTLKVRDYSRSKSARAKGRGCLRSFGVRLRF